MEGLKHRSFPCCRGIGLLCEFGMVQNRVTVWEPSKLLLCLYSRLQAEWGHRQTGDDHSA